MIVSKKSVANFAYKMLILLTVFSPERFGTTLKYVIIPSVLMVFFYGIQKKITPIKSLGFVFLLIILISTAITDCEGVEKSSANLRSLCILVVLFIVLSDIDVSREELEQIKSFYIFCVCLCGIIVLVRSLGGSVNRYQFTFLWGLKDVNYLLAFMLPGAYVSFRRILFEGIGNRIINIFCIASTIISIMLFQTRAAFVTIICVIALVFLEYISEKRLSWKKVVVIALVIFGTIVSSMWIVTSPTFSRLTSASSYEDNIRLIIWENALKAFEAHKIWGSGIGASSYYSFIVTKYQSHNSYIDILGDFGMLGMATFILILFFTAKVRKEKCLFMVAYIVASLLPFAFINGFQTVVFWLPMMFLAQESNCINTENAIEKNGRE